MLVAGNILNAKYQYNEGRPGLDEQLEVFSIHPEERLVELLRKIERKQLGSRGLVERLASMPQAILPAALGATALQQLRDDEHDQTVYNLFGFEHA